LTKVEIDEFFANIKEEKYPKKTENKTAEINKNINLFSEGGLIQQEKK